jgi:hypothetical protein
LTTYENSESNITLPVMMERQNKTTDADKAGEREQNKLSITFPRLSSPL